jgi:uncharacterized membrane protein YphA (DoxX/SURF4 family)
MKVLVTITRIVVGVLFIFSGLMKAIDPWGLTYSTQEFFEAFINGGVFPSLINLLTPYTFWLSLLMISLETLVGVSLLLGIYKKMTVWVLLLLILFFTFLTGYAFFTDTVKECGCFGNCIPLTPLETFLKNIALLALIGVLLFGQKYILPVFSRKACRLLFALSIFGVIYLQWYVLRYLPVKDCLPYKIGNNIAELRKMPSNAIPDKFDYVFVYEKAGAKKEFTAATLPDSSWKFVDRKQTLVQKGKNNMPAINDFSLTNQNGDDLTDSILHLPGQYYLLFIKDLKNSDRWLPDFYKFYSTLNDESRVFLVTSDFKEADKLFNESKDPVGLKILICDATAIKTAARVNPTLYKMNGPVVANKWSWADFDDAMKK